MTNLDPSLSFGDLIDSAMNEFCALLEYYNVGELQKLQNMLQMEYNEISVGTVAKFQAIQLEKDSVKPVIMDVFAEYVHASVVLKTILDKINYITYLLKKNGVK